MLSHKIIRLALVILLTLVSLNESSCSSCNAKQKAPASSADAYDLSFNAAAAIDALPGKPAEIFYSNDLLATVAPIGGNPERRYGGLAMRASAIQLRRQTLQAKGSDLLLVDAGNTLFATKSSGDAANQNAAMELARNLVTMGYDAVAVGENEWAAGLSFLQNLTQQTKLPLLCGNIVTPNSQKKSLFTDRLLLKRGAVTFGVTAVTSPKLLTLRLPTITNLGFEVESPLDSLQRNLKLLKEEGAEVLVVLAHMPWEEQLQLAEKLPESVIFVAGHGTHRTLVPVIRGQSAIVQTPPRGKFLGMMRLVARSSEVGVNEGVKDATPFVLIDLRLKRLLAKSKPDVQKIQKAQDELKRFQETLREPTQANRHLLFNFMIALEQKISG